MSHALVPAMPDRWPTTLAPTRPDDADPPPPRCPPRTVFLIGGRGVAWAILRAALASLPGATVTGEAHTLTEALATIPTSAPDVVISSSMLADGSTLPVLAALHARCPATTLVVYDATLDAPTLRACAHAGVTGYLGWQLDYATFQQSLAALLTGPVVVGSLALTELLLAAPAAAATPPPLGARERLVLTRLAAGLTRAQIAHLDRLSLRTVERATAELMAKLDAPSPFVLGMKAAQLGLVPVQEGAQPEAAPARAPSSQQGIGHGHSVGPARRPTLAESRQVGYCLRERRPSRPATQDGT
ncbi:MAG TPA: LuxR C-terminal-related transcriptional regulator [Dehalococcoidia bacterium]|nr:LuxR C-terminal-related transcriptional regulator [Dehalococcoidia bacterium]